MKGYPKFTQGMKKTHTILVPDMLPIHFRLLISVFRAEGYKMELLQNRSRSVVDEGLKNVHNDSCYPALLVIGQFIDALNSGKYDPDRTALLITQTGGGCRASNYIHLLRKAMAKTYPQVPVVSLNFSGLEKDSGFRITPLVFYRLLYAIIYGDVLMTCYNKCRAYERTKGDSDRILRRWQNKISNIFLRKSREYLDCKKICNGILKDFSAISLDGSRRIKVGIVGEIYVKYSPLANNNLEDFLISEGCEPVTPPLIEFILYCISNVIHDSELYDRKNLKVTVYRLVYKIILKKISQISEMIRSYHKFRPFDSFEKLRKLADRYINQGVSMGEGWLIPAEMACFAKTGVSNIISAQPFGCLPNHIVAKGMIRAVKRDNPHANITPIDYDPGASKVNQENRIRLMLANAEL